MKKKIVALLSIAAITSMFVGCSSNDGVKGDVLPQYFVVEANKDVNVDGFESVYSKIYDINNDGILEELELVKKTGKAYILIKHAETGVVESAIKVEENTTGIAKISDEDSDGIEEIIVTKSNDGEDIYRYNAANKGYEA